MFFATERQSAYTCIGLMSGTSLDGLDICLCQFKKIENNKWNHTIIKATTLPYPSEIRERLKTAPCLSGEELTLLDYEYGHWLGKAGAEFIKETSATPLFMASHGHTVFHNPSNGYTLQIGKGSAIATEIGIPCISDFRSSDVCNGGQGAPLVPIGDKLLFPEYDICINLGGIANLSFDNALEERIAYDIGPCNMLLNHLAGLIGKEFDKNGEIGNSGNLITTLLNQLNDLEYYKLSNPKSLGREWFEQIVLPLILQYQSPVEDKLRTAYEHIAQQIALSTNAIDGIKILITGGGAKNKFLVDLIKQKSTKSVVIPDTQTIDFKEALIFAFLGVLYIERQHGALASVTGAKTSSICGCLYL